MISPYFSADAVLNGSVRTPTCVSIIRSSQAERISRLRGPGVRQIPNLISAMTTVESNVSLACACNQSTTFGSGTVFCNSLNTLVSIKIIEDKCRNTVNNSAIRELHINAGAGHGDQLVNPVFGASRHLRTGGSVTFRRLIFDRVWPVQYKSPNSSKLP